VTAARPPSSRPLSWPSGAGEHVAVGRVGVVFAALEWAGLQDPDDARYTLTNRVRRVMTAHPALRILGPRGDRGGPSVADRSLPAG
jgi:hypothetical protein